MTRRVALVTGGMGGIGTAVCRKLAQSNGNIVVANCLPGYPQKDAWLAAMHQAGLAGLSDHLKRLSANGDPLEQLARIIDFEAFRPTLVTAAGLR